MVLLMIINSRTVSIQTTFKAMYLLSCVSAVLVEPGDVVFQVLDLEGTVYLLFLLPLPLLLTFLQLLVLLMQNSFLLLQSLLSCLQFSL